MSKKGYIFNNFLIYQIPLIFMYKKTLLEKTITQYLRMHYYLY